MKKMITKGAGLDAIIQDTTKKPPPEDNAKADEEMASLKKELEQKDLASRKLNDELKEFKKKVGEEIPQGSDRELVIATLRERAQEFDGKGNLLDAFHLYRRVLRLNPNDVEALYQLATLYYSAEMREKAIECLYAILEINPDHKEAVESLEELKSDY